MKRQIVIIIPQAPNFELLAFKYFLLSLNQKLSTLEFSFVDLERYIFLNKVMDYEKAVEIFRETEKNINIPKYDFIFCVVSFRFTDNHFTHSSGNLSFITTDVWEKAFSPPSLFEYLVHSIISEILLMDTALELNSHEDTRGCILDFCEYKADARVGILCGFISEEVKTKIIKTYGKQFIEDIETVLGRKWIGSLEEPGSVAYNLMHVFKVNLFRDSGFIKKWHEKVLDTFYDFPKKFLLLILGSILGYFFSKFK